LETQGHSTIKAKASNPVAFTADILYRYFIRCLLQRQTDQLSSRQDKSTA